MSTDTVTSVKLVRQDFRMYAECTLGAYPAVVAASQVDPLSRHQSWMDDSEDGTGLQITLRRLWGLPPVGKKFGGSVKHGGGK